MQKKFSDFDEIARWYDNFFNQIYFNVVHGRAEKMIETFLNSKGKILDIGCGTGNWLLRLAKKYKQLEFNGLDKSRGMLAVAAGKNSGIHWTVGTAENLPFAEAIFDGVSIIEAFHHFQDHVRALEQAHRVLRQDGWLLLVDPANESWSKYLWLTAKRLPFEKDANYFSSSATLAMLESGGFAVLKHKRQLANNWILARKK